MKPKINRRDLVASTLSAVLAPPVAVAATATPDDDDLPLVGPEILAFKIDTDSYAPVYLAGDTAIVRPNDIKQGRHLHI